MAEAHGCAPQSKAGGPVRVRTALVKEPVPGSRAAIQDRNEFQWYEILAELDRCPTDPNTEAQMQYFQTNFQTLTEIATLCGFDGLAGYLVLARHATGRDILGYPHHSLSGAGVNSIHEKLGCSEVRAKAILESLIQNKFVERAPSDAASAAPRSARWLLPKQYPLDTDLPHNLVDTPNLPGQVEVTSPLKRLKKLKPLLGQDKSSANCDGTMLLLAMYASTQMREFGGLPVTSTVFRSWEIFSITPNPSGRTFVWKAGNAEKQADPDFIDKALPHASDRDDRLKRFWNALKNLQEKGLLYEVVTLFDESMRKILVSLRVNDFHAGSIDRIVTGDPSLFRKLEAEFNTRFAFYEQEEEDFRATLPFPSGKLFGVYRLRFRTANPDTGQWFEEEVERVDQAFKIISTEHSEANYDDDF